MSRITRIAASAVVLVSVSSFAGIAVGQRGAGAAEQERKTLESRIAALESLRADLAGSQAKLDGLGNELNGIRQAVTSDGHSVKVTGESYLPSNLNAVIIAYQIAPTRSTMGRAVSAARSFAASVTSAVRRAGVDADDIRTVWDNAFPSWEKEGAFTAQARVLVTVRNVSRIDRISEAALAVGKDVSVGYLTVSDETDTAALAKARAEALGEAREKAQRYAQAAGRTLGTLTAVTEQVAPEDSPAKPGGDAGYEYRPSFIVIVDAVYELV